MKIQTLFGLFFAAAIFVACGQKGNTAEAADTIATDTAAVESPEANQAKIAEAKAFVERFYEGLDRDLLDYAFVKSNLTRNALRYLADNYEYDCESGDCLATWLFLYEGGGDTGPLKSRTFDMADEHTCIVQNVYEGYGSEDYEYVVLVTLVNDGDTYKIDVLKPLFSSED